MINYHSRYRIQDNNNLSTYLSAHFTRNCMIIPLALPVKSESHTGLISNLTGRDPFMVLRVRFPSDLHLVNRALDETSVDGMKAYVLHLKT